LPPIIRQAMRAWQFDQATELLAAANRALDARDEVLAKAAAADLTVPSALRATFEGDRGFAAASSEAEAELTTIGAYSQALSVRDEEPGIVEQVGLWGTQPQADLELAAAAFASGDLRTSVHASAAAFGAWDAAQDTGRSRIMTILAAIIAAAVAVYFVVQGVRGVAARRSGRASGSGKVMDTGTSGPSARPTD